MRRTREAEIVALAEQLFLEKGYQETTVDDILDRTGLSKGGFYHYFDSKDDLLRAVIRRLIDRRLGEWTAVAADPELSAVRKVQRLLAQRAALQEPDRQTARLLAMVMRSDFALYAYYMSLAAAFTDPLAKILEQGVREGGFRIAHPRETADIVLRIVASFPASSLVSEYLADAALRQRYTEAVSAAVAGVIGVAPEELT